MSPLEKKKSGGRRKWLLLAAVAAGLGLWIERSETDEDLRASALPAAPAEVERDLGQREPMRLEVAREPAQASASPDSAEGFVELQIVADGAAQAGAQVRLFRRSGRDPNTGELRWTLEGAARTDAQGLAKLPARAGRYVALAERSGSAMGLLEVRHPLGERVTRGVLELRAPALLAGQTLLRGTRAPAPLAQIVGTPTITPSLPGANDGEPEVPPQALVHAESDTEGNFKLALAPGVWKLDASAEGGGRASAAAVHVPRAQPLQLELIGSGYLEGHVLAADGSPAPGAEILARGAAGSERTTSVAGGAFSLEVAPGNWQLSARLGHDAGALAHSLAVAEGQTQRGLVLHLAAGATLAAQVSRAKDGTPLADARVAVSPHDENGDSGRCVAGVGGSCLVEGLAPGLYDVVVELEGYARSETRGVALGKGQRTELQFPLAADGSIEGTVRDSKGRPIEGASIEARSEGMGEPALARTGPDGTFRVRSVHGRTQLSASRPGAALGPSATVVVADGATAHHDFKLAETGRISGRVSAASGALPDGVLVSATRLQGSASAGVEGETSRAPVSSDGTYSLELPAGPYRLQASAPGGAATSSREQIAVEANETAIRDLVLPAASDSGLTIRVLEPGGAPSPLARVELSARTGGGFYEEVMTDASGVATISRARSDLPDTISLTASNGSRTGHRAIGPGETTATIQLAAAASLHGTVLGARADGTFELVARSSNGNAVTTSGPLHFSGTTFALDDQPAGSIELSVQTSDGRSGSASTSLAPGEDGNVEISVQTETLLFGHAVDPNGAPVAGALLSIDGTQVGRTDASGGFHIAPIEPGTHTLHGVLELQLETTREFEIADGQQLDLGAVPFAKYRLPAGMIGLSLRGDSSGVFVVSVVPDSPAEQAGLLIGDQIVLVDGVAVNGIADAISRIRGAAGASVVLSISRSGQVLILQMIRSS